MAKAETALDVWLRFDGDNEEAEAEANTFRHHDGFVVRWYLNSVGLVGESPVFPTRAEARAWLTAEGFEDYSS